MKILSIRQKDFEKQADKNYSASPEIVEVEICNRQTDNFFDTIYGARGCEDFFSVNFATSLLTLLAGG